MTTLTACETLADTVKKLFLLQTEYKPTDADIEVIKAIMADTDNTDVEHVIDEYIRFDSKTGAMMYKGWLVADTEYYANEEDALAEVKKMGFNSFLEANSAYGNDPDECNMVFYTEWWDGEGA